MPRPRRPGQLQGRNVEVEGARGLAQRRGRAVQVLADVVAGPGRGERLVTIALRKQLGAGFVCVGHC